MKKHCKMDNLGCANCAAKMEERIRKRPGVADASINFTLQRLSLDAPDEQMDSILSEAQKIVKSIEPDCSIVF